MGNWKGRHTIFTELRNFRGRTQLGKKTNSFWTSWVLDICGVPTDKRMSPKVMNYVKQELRKEFLTGAKDPEVIPDSYRSTIGRV